MSCFYRHKDYLFRKKTEWSLRFRDEFRKVHGSNNLDKIQRKYRIPLYIIDRNIIFHLRNDGFDLYVNMKGNVYEFRREIKGIYKREIMLLFSTIRIRIKLKDDELILHIRENI
ncbi:unnamed protein product [Rotaria sp. Silwood2]|nr:unnamed protein product [Rotaria sp. Silwood2]CAF4155956.1 unnamed protein product [Rotaria sp. Silwood2]